MKALNKMESYLDNRIKLISKIDNNKRYKPTQSELQNAYGYLDYCNYCGKQIRFAEPFSHGCLGNNHKFGCSFFMRCIGLVYNILTMLIIKIPLFIIIAPFYFSYLFIKKKLGYEEVI